MKKIFILVVLIVLTFLGKAQTVDTTSNTKPHSDTTLDQLQVPASPAFNLLGISPNNIERPKSPTDFAIGIGNAFLNGIPRDYSIEIAPYWIFSKKKNFSDFKSNKINMNILQTATISAGTTFAKSGIDSSEFRKVAIALKFSILRGEMGKEFKMWSDSIGTYLANLNESVLELLKRLLEEDELLKEYKYSLDTSNAAADRLIWGNKIRARKNELQEIAANAKPQASSKRLAILAQLKSLQSRLDFNRYGPKLDFAMGLVMDYPDSNFQNCYVSKFSAWLTGGVEIENELNLLGVIRFSQNFNRKFLNDSNKIVNNINLGEVDYGIRLYKDVAKKFTFSFECMGRKSLYNQDVLVKNKVKEPVSTDRYMFSINYKVGKNQNLSFSYGKNFDNVYVKGGNLIAALHFAAGFGSLRPVGGF